MIFLCDTVVARPLRAVGFDQPEHLLQTGSVQRRSQLWQIVGRPAAELDLLLGLAWQPRGDGAEDPHEPAGRVEDVGAPQRFAHEGPVDAREVPLRRPEVEVGTSATRRDAKLLSFDL